MSDEHSEGSSGRAGDAPAVDPALFQRADVRRMLAALDIGGLYRVLGAEAGLTQRQIAACTGQSQSEVSDIVAGRRRVESRQVLVRIAEAFDIPRELLGLSWWGPDGTYCGEDTPKKEDEAVRRRTLIATTTMAAFGQAVQGLGELTELALPTGDSLPLRLSMEHVQVVRAVTERLRGVGREFGGQAELFGAAAQRYVRWMAVPGSDVVKARLGAALAELYTEAGWAYYDSGMDATGCFTRALRLAHKAGDTVGIANAAWQAGATMHRSGHPNDALKCFQLGQFTLRGVALGEATSATARADDPRIPTLAASLSLGSASAYALMGHPEQATRCLMVAREGWVPRDAFERAHMDRLVSVIQLDLGRLDTAEQFAASAVRNYGDGPLRRAQTRAELTLAEVQVRAGEPRGLVLAQRAIESVRTLQSVAVRQERLVPLITALEARPGNDAKEIARIAHQVAATRG